eukprot:TRINITY_DN7097_c0_g1_i1.p1 TRINITY_DN7097_c0_g1~~TRINITY_DN7097_c0_g1_i1.p1  ORF type:complete len:279 (+),score=47.63 TRINITY_DN7097_c0_g1_i1:288-1124(+)
MKNHQHHDAALAQVADRREQLADQWVRHRDAIPGFCPDVVFHPSFLAMLKDGAGPEGPEKVFPGVFKLPRVFTDGFTQLLIREAEEFMCSGLPNGRPCCGRVNWGVVLNEIGFSGLIEEMMHVFNQLSSRLFGEVLHVTEHFAYLIGYRPGEASALPPHTDFNDVTLNICLGQPGFIGSALKFRRSEHDPHPFEYLHEPGAGVLHRGNAWHEVTPITSGERINFIIMGIKDDEHTVPRARRYQLYLSGVERDQEEDLNPWGEARSSATSTNLARRQGS